LSFRDALTARIVHATLLDYLSHRGPEDGALLDLVRPKILQLITSKEGVNVAMLCLWLSPAKVSDDASCLRNINGSVVTILGLFFAG